MGHGLALDQAAWASPWRARSVRDKGLISLGLLALAVALPPIPGGAAVAVVSVALLAGPIRVRGARLVRIVWVPLTSILIGAATVAVSIGWDAGPLLRVTPDGLSMAGRLAVRAIAATLAMLTLACSTPMVDLLEGLRRLRVPDPLLEITALSYRFSVGLLENAAAIYAAQEARLGYATPSAAMRSASWGVVALFARSWSRARRLEVELAGRGYPDALRTLEPERRRSARFLLTGGAGVLLIAVGAVVWETLR